MYAAILKEGSISDMDLMEKCGRMSIATYNKYKPYLLRHKVYGDKVNFDKPSKTWSIAMTTLEKMEQEAKMNIEEKQKLV